ncbi:hypothetical protein BP5796_06104 [Coleophoma crateriformis]|uniref:Dimethylaniline monooxygenase n=1 Tax=Coleophoma crateriformis TaxID=565419 RepID=A0A3D8RW08_9HELO|nr:hypothetical protein BP5796_06104 [Coleophoma crateriformis]
MPQVRDEPPPARPIKSVAIIGAGASGAITAAAFHAENYFDRIRVFERRETAGGTWNYDANPDHGLAPRPGALPAETDPPIPLPTLKEGHVRTTKPNAQQRYHQTPIYDNLTTNVPDIAMSFSDRPFAYGPFVPYWVPRQYIEDYFSTHSVDGFLQLGTTVEDLSKLKDKDGWKLTLRKYNGIQQADEWWEETFDAVVIANGHYSIPYIPYVPGLEAYMKNFPQRVQHSKSYRRAADYKGRKVLIIGNSASGHDVTAALLASAELPVYQSRRSTSRWDGAEPPQGIVWKPIVSEYLPNGRIYFEDRSSLDDVDTIIYCTGYKFSYPFWNLRNNGRVLWDYTENRVPGTYLHTFLPAHPTVGLVGVPRVLTFRSFEYQAIALARVFSGRSKRWGSITEEDKQNWEEDRLRLTTREKRKFHDIEWETGETWAWFQQLFELAGLGTLGGEGRLPPVLEDKVVWAIENVKKYPEPNKDGPNDGDDSRSNRAIQQLNEDAGWIVVGKGTDEPALRAKKDLLSFI